MIYDASMPLRNGMPTYDGNVPFKRTLQLEIAKGKPCNQSVLELGAHSGTHLDAPFHFIDGTEGIEKTALDTLVGRARVVDLTGRPFVDRADLERLDLAGVTRLLMKTDNSLRWARGEGFDRTKQVYLTGPGAKLVVERGIRLLGTDGLGIEQPGSLDHPAHKTLLGARVTLVEGLYLEEVPPGDYFMTCGPLRIEGGDGAPARVLLFDRASAVSF